MPITALLTIAGLALLAKSDWHADIENRRLALTVLCAAAMCVWFLFVFSQTTNVNSGGTLYVSRYALWLIPLALPAIAVSSRYLDARVPGMMLVGGIALFAAYLSYFHPDQGERYVEHSPQAAWLMTHVSAAYRPIPEIFVERTLHIDGGARASAADPDVPSRARRRGAARSTMRPHRVGASRAFSRSLPTVMRRSGFAGAPKAPAA